ncbi:MAG: signal peptide peptidase SppA [Natronomonas sp.]|nr:signal peptide peptidase SppA [Natronomonas sp.]
MNGLNTAGRLAIALVVGLLAAVVGWLLFVAFPTSTAELFGVLLAIGVAVGGLRFGGSIAQSVFPAYNAVEVAVEGAITRDGGGGIPIRAPGSASADDIVELIEEADADENAEALVLKLNTPGGEVVPSDDIRRAVAGFDGPTIAYATDLCASGGYWIASGCDELWAREGSIVGSIGVRGSRMTASGLLEKAGLEYEQLTAGEYKEAGSPFSELSDDERAYLQGIIDDYYEQFVETVAEGRDADPETLRDTEARVFLGEEAAEMGLVDQLGTREDVETRLEELLGSAVETTELKPSVGLGERLRGGAQGVAYAFGAGIAARFDDPSGEFRFRL